jgi:glutamate/aspartate transport system permease protein
MGEMTFRYFEAFGAATLIYAVIALGSNRVMAWLERKVAVPGYIGAAR